MPYADRADYNRRRRAWRRERALERRAGQAPSMVFRHVGFTPAELTVVDRMAAEANMTRSALIRDLIDEAILARANSS